MHAKGESPGTVYHSMDPGVPEGKAADAQAVPCGRQSMEIGLYNDMAGHARDTEEWLQWIPGDGDYAQAEEEDALSSMPDFWTRHPGVS